MREYTEKEFADLIYIFTSPNKPGIKFYDRSPDGAVAKLTGSLPQGKFQTDIHSISQATWDSEVNKANASQVIRFSDGNLTVTTIMVSPIQMAKIIKSISESKDKSHIIIDVGKKKNNKSNIIDIAELKQLRNLLKQSKGSIPVNKYDLSNKKEFEEYVSRSKK